MSYTCLVCGYNGVERNPKEEACFEICPCCHFEYNITDEDLGFTYEQWREKWIKEGMKFWWEEDKPQNWDPKRQLLNIGVKT